MRRLGYVFGAAVLAMASAFVACGTAHSVGFGEAIGADGGDESFGFGGDSGDATGPCVGLGCQQVSCPDGGSTTVTGTVYAPNGTMPLYDVIVYVPNAPVSPFTKGVTCDQCGAAVSGKPVVTTLSAADGTFTLSNVPAGTDLPLVIQLGKWRRQVKIPNVQSCKENKLPANLTRLPRTQQEGDMPHIALTTGGCDNVGCMLPKVGIDQSEFGVEGNGDAKAVHVFRGSGGGGASNVGPAAAFWNDAARLKNYDMLMLSCECEEAPQTKDAAAYGAVFDYLEAGGRVFTTDFQYTWYKYSPDPGLRSVSNIPGGAPDEGDLLGAPGAGNPITLDTTFPKAAALGQWLRTLYPTAADVKDDEVTMDYVFGNFQSTDATKSQTWARSPNRSGGSALFPRVMTVNVPVGVPETEQCGKGVHIDAHVDNPNMPGSTDAVDALYPATCKDPLKEGEAMLAFFFFDLAACIQNDDKPPQPPPIK